MDPDVLPVPADTPPTPPPFPPPVPPPVACAHPAGEPSRYWKWSDRLALVMGGLTIFLVGVVTGRSFVPSLTEEETPAVAAAEVSGPEGSSSREGDSAPEVNPPELTVASLPAARELAEAFSSHPEGATAAESPVSDEPAKTSALAATTKNELPLAAAVTPAATIPAPAAETASGEPAESLPTEGLSAGKSVATIRVPAAAQVCEAEEKFKDRKLNTALTWAESVGEASQQAEEQDKLVFLIHVSGNFEMPGFT